MEESSKGKRDQEAKINRAKGEDENTFFCENPKKSEERANSEP